LVLAARTPDAKHPRLDGDKLLGLRVFGDAEGK